MNPENADIINLSVSIHFYLRTFILSIKTGTCIIKGWCARELRLFRNLCGPNRYDE